MSIVQIVLLGVAGNFAITGSRLVITLAALKIDASPFVVGLLHGAYSVLPLMLGVWAGRLIDRSGAMKPLRRSAFALVLAPLAPVIWLDSLAALFLAAAIFGTSFLFFSVANQNLVGMSGDSSNRTTLFSWMMIGTAAGNTIGPVVVGYAIDHAGFRAAFGLLALPPLVMALWMLGWHIAEKPAGAIERARARQPLLGIVRERTIAVTLVVSIVLTVGWDAFAMLAPVYGSSIGLTASAIGIVMAFFPGAMLAIRSLMPLFARRFGEWTLMAMALGGAAIGYFVLPFATDAAGLSASAAVLGLGLGIGFPVVIAASFAASPPGRQAEVMGLRTSATHVCHVIVPVLAGAATGALGFGPVLWTIGGALALSAWATWRWRPRDDASRSLPGA